MRSCRCSLAWGYNFGESGTHFEASYESTEVYNTERCPPASFQMENSKLNRFNLSTKYIEAMKTSWWRDKGRNDNMKNSKQENRDHINTSIEKKRFWPHLGPVALQLTSRPTCISFRAVAGCNISGFLAYAFLNLKLRWSSLIIPPPRQFVLNSCSEEMKINIRGTNTVRCVSEHFRRTSEPHLSILFRADFPAIPETSWKSRGETQHFGGISATCQNLKKKEDTSPTFPKIMRDHHLISGNLDG